MAGATEAIILTKRGDVAYSLRSCLRAMGIDDEQIITVRSMDGFKQNYRPQTQIYLLDWEGSETEVLKVLAEIKPPHHILSVPTLLFASHMSSKVVALGGEYSVTAVHVGELSNASVRMMIKQLFDASKEKSPLRDSFQKITELRMHNQWEQATTTLEDLNHRDPDDPKIAAELGENYIRTDKWQDALNLLGPFANEDPPDVRILGILGRCYLKLKRPTDAIHFLSRAKIMSPYNVDRLIELGQAYLQIDEIDSAQQVFEEALDLNANSKEALQGKGQCLLLQNEVNEGLRLIQSTSDNRELAAIFNTTAVLSIRRNQHTNAMKLYDTAIFAVGTDRGTLARLYFNKGIGFFRAQRYHEARECFQKSLSSDPEFSKSAHNIRVIDQIEHSNRYGNAAPKSILHSEGSSALDLSKLKQKNGIVEAKPKLAAEIDDEEESIY